MVADIQKRYSTIGCCGINCGLCPRYYTVGKSKCPGCQGENFIEKHPSCSFITCCVKKKNLETCADCIDYPCPKFAKWDMGDSFVTHQNCKYNLEYIKKNGLKDFIKQQKERMDILEMLLDEFDDGKSKSFYCLATGLLPLNELKRSVNDFNETLNKKNKLDKKELAKTFREILNKRGERNRIELEYRRA
jgi:hypothetical protein